MLWVLPQTAADLEWGITGLAFPGRQFLCDEFCADDYDKLGFVDASSAAALPMREVGGSTLASRADSGLTT
jgi:hypothetical protein